MTELTQKLLVLDSQTNKELELSKELAQKVMIKADSHAKKMMSEAKEVFNKQKENDIEILSNNLEKKRLLSIEILKKNKQKFDEHFDIDELVKHLILVAKEKVCH